MLFSQLPGFRHHATAFACLWGDDDLAAAKSGAFETQKNISARPKQKKTKNCASSIFKY